MVAATQRSPLLPVTVGAALESLVVRNHNTAGHHRLLGVTVSTRNSIVRALQREIGLLFMAEGGRTPGCHRMTGRAIGRLFSARELTSVYVFVTTGTLARGLVKYNRARAVSNHRTMTLDASHRPVSAQQPELGGGMIEGCGLLPGAYVVAKLTALLGIARGVALVWVLMAVDASHRVEVIASRWWRKAVHWRLVTLAAGRRCVPSG